MMNVYILIGAFLVSVFLGRIIIPNILIMVHNRPIPRLGGVTFFPVIVFTFAVVTALRVMVNNISYEVFTPTMACEFLFLIAGLTLLYIIGIADDLVGVRYRKKFLVQIISASLFPVAGLYINNFYDLFHTCIHWLSAYSPLGSIHYKCYKSHRRYRRVSFRTKHGCIGHLRSDIHALFFMELCHIGFHLCRCYRSVLCI